MKSGFERNSEAMIVKTLSNHPRDRLDQLDRQAEAERDATAAHHAAVARLRAENAAGRRWWQFGLRRQHHNQEYQLALQAPQPDPRLPDRRAAMQAGVDAEDRMTAALGYLSDDWTLLRGYKNSGGEIDHLLIGPGGMWAIEVKSSPLHIHVNGDEWTYDKYDKYGNYVGESGKLTDNGGRSWGQQVTEPAAKLEEFLATRGLDVPIYTAVVVLHDRASFGELNNLKTVVSAGPEYFLSKIDEHWRDIDQPTRQTIVELAERDHKFHTQNRRKRPQH
jgi:Nuclease-related domain